MVSNSTRDHTPVELCNPLETLAEDSGAKAFWRSPFKPPTEYHRLFASIRFSWQNPVTHVPDIVTKPVIPLVFARAFAPNLPIRLPYPRFSERIESCQGAL